MNRIKRWNVCCTARQRIRGYGLKVEINGAKGKLLLDSGASGILINRKWHKRLVWKPWQKRISTVSVTRAASQGISALPIPSKSAISNFRDASSRLRIETQWRRKTDLLVRCLQFFLVDIDFPNYKLHLTPLPPMPPPSDAEKALVAQYPGIARFRDRVIPQEFKDFTPVYRFNHMLLIPTRINELPSKLFSDRYGRLQRHDLSRGRPRSHESSFRVQS